MGENDENTLRHTETHALQQMLLGYYLNPESRNKIEKALKFLSDESDSTDEIYFLAHATCVACIGGMIHLRLQSLEKEQKTEVTLERKRIILQESHSNLLAYYISLSVPPKDGELK